MVGYDHNDPAARAAGLLRFGSSRDPALERDWRGELDGMAARIRSVRQLLAAADPRLAYLVGQHGLFGMLPLSPAQMAVLRERHAIYIPSSGRINIAGLTAATVAPFAAGLMMVW